MEKVNPQTKKVVQVKKAKSDFCGLSQSKIFTKCISRNQDFEKKQTAKKGNVALCQIQHGVI